MRDIVGEPEWRT